VRDLTGTTTADCLQLLKQYQHFTLREVQIRSSFNIYLNKKIYISRKQYPGKIECFVMQLTGTHDVNCAPLPSFYCNERAKKFNKI
jgi:hypothetical protein